MDKTVKHLKNYTVFELKATLNAMQTLLDLEMDFSIEQVEAIHSELSEREHPRVA